MIACGTLKLAAPTTSSIPAVVTVLTVAVAAVAVAAGAIAVPDLAGALSDATDSLNGWVYLAVAAVVFLETTALAGFLIHGELVLMVGGLAAERGDAALPVVIALAWAAAIAGDVVSLLLGRRLGRPFLHRHGHRIRLGAARLARVDAFFARHGGKALLLGRFTGFLRATMPFVAGTSGTPLRRLLPVSALSGLVWTATFTLLGHASAESLTRTGDVANRVVFATLLLVAAALVLRSRLPRRA